MYQNARVVPVRIAAFWKMQTPEYSQIPAEEDSQYPKLNIEEHTARTDRLPTNRLSCEDEMGRPENLARDFETTKEDVLTTRETVKLSLEFCVLWVSNSPELVRHKKLTYVTVCGMCKLHLKSGCSGRQKLIYG